MKSRLSRSPHERQNAVYGLLTLVLCVAACGESTSDTGTDGQADVREDGSARDVPSRDTSGTDDVSIETELDLEELPDSSGNEDVEPDRDVVDNLAECGAGQAFFENELWPRVLETACAGCHTESGVASQSGLKFATWVEPDYLGDNYRAFAAAASIHSGGSSIVLRKPIGELEHGGGVVFSADSEQYASLSEFVAQLSEVGNCAVEEDLLRMPGLVLQTNAQTVRRAALMVGGVYPTESQLAASTEEELAAVITEFVESEAFVQRVARIYEDLLGMQSLQGGVRALELLDTARFPDYAQAARLGAGALEKANRSTTRQAVEIVAHVVREDLPFSEILTANYTVLNGYAAVSHSISESGTDPEEMRVVRFRDLPHAGILTTTGFLGVHQTTATNRNRHRASEVLRVVLGVNVQDLNDRPFDATSTDYFTPTMNDPNCTVCHSVMDPVAGAFRAFDDVGRYNAEIEWPNDMFAPGFAGETMVLEEREDEIVWLAERLAKDERFVHATVAHFFENLTGHKRMRPPSKMGLEASELDDAVAAYRTQQAWLRYFAEKFEESGLNARVLAREILMSPYFRLDDLEADAPIWMSKYLGERRSVTAEELAARTEILTGVAAAVLRDYAREFSSISVAPANRPSAVSAVPFLAFQLNAYRASYETLFRELADLEEPTLLGQWTRRAVPGGSGEISSENADIIAATIEALVFRMLGREVARDSAEVQGLVDLFVDVFNDVDDSMLSGSADFTWATSVFGDPLRAREFAAWSAVLTVLMTDSDFLFE